MPPVPEQTHPRMFRIGTEGSGDREMEEEERNDAAEPPTDERLGGEQVVELTKFVVVTRSSRIGTSGADALR